jgi:uncharacterized protein (TIGR02118 family)
MRRLMVLYNPPDDPEHFRRHYVETHLPLAAKMPGLRGYRYGLDLNAPEGDAPYFCVFEGDFDDAASLGAALESPEGQTALADVPNYATGGLVVLDFEVQDPVG